MPDDDNPDIAQTDLARSNPGESELRVTEDATSPLRKLYKRLAAEYDKRPKVSGCGEVRYLENDIMATAVVALVGGILIGLLLVVE